MTTFDGENINAFKARLLAEGWTLLRTKSHQALVTKLGIARARVSWSEDNEDHLRRMLQQGWDEQRHLRDRCSFLYEQAIQHGATVEELRGPLSAAVQTLLEDARSSILETGVANIGLGLQLEYPNPDGSYPSDSPS